jgi:hypothetical protein
VKPRSYRFKLDSSAVKYYLNQIDAKTSQTKGKQNNVNITPIHPVLHNTLKMGKIINETSTVKANFKSVTAQ